MTYSVYNIRIDSNLSFAPGLTAGYVLSANADGSTQWVSPQSGSSGASGSSGSSGVNGATGSSGTSGVNGTSGSAGTSGTSTSSLWIQKKSAVLSTGITASSTSYVAISEFDFSITAGKSYRVIITGSTKAPAATTGMAIFFDNMTGSGNIAASLISLTNTSNFVNNNSPGLIGSGQNTGTGTMYETIANAGINVITPFVYHATINATASTTLFANYRSETTANTTLQSGTILTVEEF